MTSPLSVCAYLKSLIHPSAAILNAQEGPSAAVPCPRWVKMRNTRKERIISASPLSTDIIKHERHVGKVPKVEVAALVRSSRRHGRAPGCDSHSGSTACRNPSAYRAKIFGMLIRAQHVFEIRNT